MPTDTTTPSTTTSPPRPSAQESAAFAQAWRQATPEERQQLRDQITASGDSTARMAMRSAAEVEQRIADIAAALHITSEEATLLLASTFTRTGHDTEGLVEKVAFAIDTHWADLELERIKLAPLLGRQGERVLLAAERLVNKARKARGARAVRVVLELREKAQAEALKRRQAATPPSADGSPTPLDQEALEAETEALYQEMVDAVAGTLGKDPAALIIGTLTASEIHLLLRCKRFVMELAPAGAHADPEDFDRDVWQHWTYCLRRGASSPWEIEERARHRENGSLLQRLTNRLHSPGAVEPDMATAQARWLQHLRDEAASKGFNPDATSSWPVP